MQKDGVELRDVVRARWRHHISRGGQQGHGAAKVASRASPWINKRRMDTAKPSGTPRASLGKFSPRLGCGFLYAVMPDRYMPGYTPRIVSFMTMRSAETHAQFFLPHLRPGLRLLDCGCGPGTITRGLAARVASGEVIGVDLEASQIALAQQDPGNPANLRFVQAGVYALPFLAAQFDAVFSHALFEHIAEPGARGAGNPPRA